MAFTHKNKTEADIATEKTRETIFNAWNTDAIQCIKNKKPNQFSYANYFDCELKPGQKGKKNSNYQAFLNKDCKDIVDIGIGVGLQSSMMDAKFISDWKITGYESSPTALEYLRSSTAVQCREFNLMDPESYRNILQADLSKITNIFMINVLFYLKTNTPYKLQVIETLLWNCIEMAKPGTVYFIVNCTYAIIHENIAPSENPKKQLKLYDEICSAAERAPVLRQGYVPSFFGARTDFSILHLEYQENEKSTFFINTNVSPELRKAYDAQHEILIVKKR